MTYGTVSRAGRGMLCGLLLCALMCSCTSSGGTPAADAVAPAAEQPAGPVIKVQTGHAWGITGLAITPDGRRIVTASADRSIRVWDAESGKELRSLVGHAAGVGDVDVSSSGKVAISAGNWDGTVRVWDLDTGTELRVLRGHKSFYSVAISPDGTAAVSFGRKGGDTYETLCWNLQTGVVVRTLPSTGGAVLDLAYAPDGKSFASASEDGTVTIWPVSTFGMPKVLKAHKGKARCIAFSPDGTLLASGGQDGVVRIWDPSTGKEARVLEGIYGEVVSATFGGGASELAVAYAHETIQLWDVAAGRHHADVQEHAPA
jgi:WD40 repeat protein